MEAIAASDGCVNPIACSGFLEDTTAGMPAARRRLAEIRRLKTLSNSGNFADIVKKRSRTLNGQLCSVCFGKEVAATEAASVNTMEIEMHSQTLYPARRLVRSVSTPISWKGGLFCTCSLEKFWSKDNIAKQNTTGNIAKENTTGNIAKENTTTINNVPVNENSSSNKNNNSKSDVNNDTIPTVTSEAESMVQDLSPQAEVTVNNPACEMQQTKTVRVDDEGSKVKMQIPPTTRTPPLPLPSGSCSAVSSSVIGPAQPNSEESVAAHICRPLKAISRANSESISLLLKDPCPPHGIMSVIGRRREMEDAVSAVPSFFSLSKSNIGVSQNGLSGLPTPPTPTPLHFFGVYDGHGGSQASIFCKNRFHEALAEELRNVPSFSRDVNDWNKVMSACFMKMDIAVGGMCPNGDCGNGDAQMISDCCQDPVAPENVGSTAVIAVVSPSQFVIANCGDSRAVLCRGGRAIPLSNDHKPEREDELNRIEAAGGRVIFWNGHRVGGFLAMSRAIGDRFLKRYVISEPEVTCIERTHEDECLILASDGLWDVLSNDTVCEVARKCLAGYRPHRSKGITEDTPVGAAAALLTKLALGRGSGDNISVIVIDLKERRNRNR